jgi:hypothetical protein
VQAASQQQLAQAMATPLQILPRVVTGAGQIPHGLVGRRGRLHHGQQAGSPEFGELPRITPIRLHPFARLPRYERRRNHRARHPCRRQLSL